MLEKLKINKDILFPLVAVLIVFLRQWILIDKGINYEEAKDIECFNKIANGEIPYRDFWWPYGPLPLYFFGFFFKWFDAEGFLFPRFVILILNLVGAYFSYLISRFYLSPGLSLLACLFAASGFVANVHTYGHAFGMTALILTFYFLQLHVSEEKDKHLLTAGGFCGMAILSKPLGIGSNTFAAVSVYLLVDFIFAKKRAGRFAYFILSALATSLAFYLPLALMTPLAKINASLNPLFYVYNMPKNPFKSFPPVFPLDIFGAQSLASAVQIMNHHLTYSLRWWLIMLAIFFGIVYFLGSLKKNAWTFAVESRVIFVLLVFSVFFEFQLLVMTGTSPYVNMLPTYILFLVFAGKIKSRLYLAVPTYAFLTALFLTQFIYSPLKYFYFYKNQGAILDLHPAENIYVTPYQKKMYGDIIAYVQETAGVSDRIVVADYNSMFALLSERKDLFAEHWLIFGATSFHPYNSETTPPRKETLTREREILERIEKDNPKLILVPNRYLDSKNKDFSPFLEYLESKWDKARVFDEPGLTPGIDYNLGISIFTRKNL